MSNSQPEHHAQNFRSHHHLPVMMKLKMLDYQSYNKDYHNYNSKQIALIGLEKSNFEKCQTIRYME